MSPELSAVLADLRPRAVATSIAIHDDPELALVEHHAAELLQTWLADEGFEVTSGVADLPTAFVARAGSGSPTIAVMAEYDALPGIGHACGHNLIASGTVTAAIAAKRMLADRPAGSGTLLLIGTPGEEGAGGKVLELERGVFEGVDAAMMFHPADRTILTRRMLACLHLTVKFHGLAAHAAKNPEDGRNALGAMLLFFNGIDSLRQHVSPNARIHGVITNGGKAANVVPDLTEADFYVREVTLPQAHALLERVRAVAEGAALMTGTTVEFGATSPDYAELHPNQAMAARLQTHLAAIGVEAEPANPNDATGSTDAGNISRALPTVHPFIQVAPRGTPGHSIAMTEAATKDMAHDAMLAMAQGLAALAVDLLTEPELLAAAKAEFAADFPEVVS